MNTDPDLPIFIRQQWKIYSNLLCYTTNYVLKSFVVQAQGLYSQQFILFVTY
jgi:hypothetical protein